ncbi:MAG: glycosyltransferase 87 family protein, partial [Myxococcaceae bacterium]
GPNPAVDRAGFLSMGRAVLDAELFQDPGINTYPPPFSVVMAPVAALERLTADRAIRVLWGLAQLASLLYFTVAAASLLRLRLTLGAVALTWLASWRFVVGDLNGQNVTLLLCAVMVAAMVRSDRDSPGWAGFILGVGATLKLWPGIALWALLVRRGTAAGRAALGFFAAVALMVALAAAALGPRFFPACRFWLTEVAPVAGGAGLLNQSWKGLFLRLVLPRLESGDYDGVQLPQTPQVQQAGALAVAISGALLVMVLLWLAVRRAHSARVRALDAFLAVYALLPALPLTWFHYLCAGIPLGLAVIAGGSELPGAPRRVARGLFVAGTLIAGFLDVDLVGHAVWAAAARAGNVLWGSLFILAAGLVLREAWRWADLGLGDAEFPSGARGRSLV